jgi:putative endonuclease
MVEGYYFVYITTNPGKSTFYTGFSNDLKQRVQRHYLNRGKKDTFAGRYYCHKLVYYETHTDVNQAIRREKEIKNMSRAQKIKLIESKNPKWNFIVL